MSKYYFDVAQNVFLNDSVNIIPVEAIEIDEGDFYKYLDLRNKGHLLAVDGDALIASDEPLPSCYSYNNQSKKWVIDEQKQAELKKQQQAQMWERIKTERYRRTHSGVYIKSVDKWFHTDEPSRIQYLSIQQLPQLPENMQWKTMDNSFVPMTKALLNELVMTIIQSEQADFANAERHRTAMLAAENPLDYDYSTGWQEVYNG